jgi:hypothetical protein
MVKAIIFIDGLQVKEYRNKKRNVLYGIAMKEFRKLASKGKNVFVLYDHSEEVI